MSVINLRDVMKSTDEDEIARWKAAFEQLGYDTDWLANSSTDLIPANEFGEYVRNEAKCRIDCCNTLLEWPFNYIDWTAAAEELKDNYDCIEVDGIEYWFRASVYGDLAGDILELRGCSGLRESSQ